METAVDITLSMLCIVIIFLHTIGIYLLVGIYKIKEKNVQHLYILYLSISEVCICVIRFVNIVTRLSLASTGYDRSIIQSVDHYCETVIFTLLSFTYYCSILLITVDRLLACCLTVKYPIYWDVNKAAYLLIGRSVTGILMYV